MSTIKTIDIAVSGLNPNQRYNFEFLNKGGNWPVKVSPLSGVFYPKSVKTYVYFCSNTGECPSSDPAVFYNIPSTNLTNAGLDLENKSLYSVLELKISDFNTRETVYTYPCVVECDECNPKLSMEFNDNMGNLVLSSDDGNSKPFSVTFLGLIPNQSYSYVLNGGGGNWPLKLTPRSGVIQTWSTDYKVEGLLSFCPSTGACPEADTSVINYVNFENRRYSQDPYSIINVSLTPSVEDLQKTVRGSFSVTCSDCIPSVQIESPSFVHVLENNDNNEFEIKVHNLVIGEKYTYNFVGVDANWPLLVSPYSGVITASADTMTLPVSVSFCPATGLCPNDSVGIMSYTTNRSSILSLDTIKKQSRFKMVLNQSSYSVPVINSNDIIAVCNDCIPKSSAKLPASALLENGDNNTSFDLELDGLIPGVEYRYSFDGLDTNWPVIVSPLSGVILASAPKHNIPVEVSVCYATGLCPNNGPNVLPYVYNSVTSLVNKNIKLKTNIIPLGSYGLPLFSSNELKVNCESCLDDTTVTLPNAVVVDETNPGLFVIEANKLLPNVEYKYKIVTTESNWPTVVSQTSGTINNKTSASIGTSVVFCAATGFCANGAPNVLPYNIGSSSQFSFGSLEKFTKLKIELDPVTEGLPTIYSNEMTVVCDNCVTPLSAKIPDNINLIGGINFNSSNFNLELEGLIPGIEYRYSFDGLDSNWPAMVSPISGTILATESSYSVPVSLTLCYSTGLCPTSGPNILSYTYNANSSSINKIVRFKANIIPSGYGLSGVSSNQAVVSCNNCLNETTIIVPSNETIDSANNYAFNAEIEGLLPNVEYKYKYVSVDGNWPAIISPISGTIRNTRTYEIPTSASFCASTGVCGNNAPNVLSYSLGSACQLNYSPLSKFTKFKLELDPVTEGLPTVYSNDITFTCDDCFNPLSVVNPSGFITLTDKDSTVVQTNINNMVVGKRYSYVVEGVDSTWPATAYPFSGTILATGSSCVLDTTVTLCPSTGLCPNGVDNVLSWSIDPSCTVNFGKVDKSVKLRLKVKEENCDNNDTYSNETRISCLGCIKPISIVNISQDLSLLLADDIVGISDTTNYQLKSSISGLIVGESYKYNINYIDSNWPTVVSAQSGSFIATDPTKNVYTDIGFCYPSGECSSDTRDAILKYKNNSLYDKSNTKFISFNMSVEPSGCNGSKSYSDDFTVKCLDCLPNIEYRVNFSGSPIMALPVGCCSGTRLMLVNINGAIPGDVHKYEFSSLSPNVTFNIPFSGYTTFQQGGSGTIMAIANTTLTNYDEAVVKFKLSNEATGFEANDYLGLKCGPECAT
jgi:hypothetical protein